MKNLGQKQLLTCAVGLIASLCGCGGGASSEDLPVAVAAAATNAVPAPSTDSEAVADANDASSLSKSTIKSAIPLTATPDSVWYTVALEGASYSVVAPAHLRFGTPQQWVYANANGQFDCGRAFFKSDPNVGVWKQCQTDNPAAKSLNVKVMTIGDSITGFYRDPLVRSITAAGLSHVDFVGNAMYSYLNPGEPDQDTNSYGGYKGLDLLKPAGTGNIGTSPGADWGYLHADERDVPLWFQGQAPDIVLLELGTNDADSNPSTVANTASKELLAYSKILAAARVSNPGVRFYVAQITPQIYGDLFEHTLNAMIPGWAAANSTRTSPVIVVDQYTGFDGSMTRDGTHPSDAMAAQMAKRWLDAIRPFLR